ncbi:fibroblast growth factor 1-like [Oculina patagonica]
MSFPSTMRRGIFVALLVLLNASLHLADRRSSAKEEVNTVNKPQPKKPRPTTSTINHALCDGPSTPILPPSFTYPGSLFSVRASMFLQILPDGTVNGTFPSKSNPDPKYAKLNIQIVSENGCMVRIQGAASQRYLVMGENGTLVAKTQPDPTRSIFTVQLHENFFTFKNGNYFIALKQGGGIKKIKENKNGRSHRRSARFVLLPQHPRKRRFPANLKLQQTRSNNLRLKLFGDLFRR